MSHHAAHTPSDSQSEGSPAQRFIEGLPDRLLALEHSLTELARARDWSAPCAQIRRRLQAMSEACSVLGLEAPSTAFASVEIRLASVSHAQQLVAALTEAHETLALIPSLIPGSVPAEPIPASAPSPLLTATAPTTGHPAAESPTPPEPITVPEPAARATIESRRQPHGNVVNLPNRTILVADADPAMAWFLTGVLRSAQADVLEARDGIEAWQLALERSPDLIVADLTLPGLDGYGLCRNIKRDIALCDVPVLLVSWHEDALQRVRELGANADGYFVKEADASTILRRCAEVLEPRANVEKRLRDNPTVQGRLHGMTPRLVLRLVCDGVGDARITFEDAGHRYFAHVGDGRLLAVERHSDDGSRETGERALGSLLGMRAGRFLVERAGDDHAVQATFAGSLSAVLAPHLARTRRTMSVLAGDALHRVARLELDDSIVEPYLRSSPPLVQKIVNKLRNGVPPVGLLRSISAGLLESTLTDLGLRDAIAHAFDESGHDLLAGNDPYAQPFDLDLRTPTAGFQLLRAAEPRVAPKPLPADPPDARAEGDADVGAESRPQATLSSEPTLSSEQQGSAATNLAEAPPSKGPAAERSTTTIPLPQDDEVARFSQSEPPSFVAHAALSDTDTDAGHGAEDGADDMSLDAAAHDTEPPATVAGSDDDPGADDDPVCGADDEAEPAGLILALAEDTLEDPRAVVPSTHSSHDDGFDMADALFAELGATPSEPQPRPKQAARAATPPVENDRLLISASSSAKPLGHSVEDDGFDDEDDPLYASFGAHSRRTPTPPPPKRARTSKLGSAPRPTRENPFVALRERQARLRRNASAWLGQLRGISNRSARWTTDHFSRLRPRPTTPSVFTELEPERERETLAPKARRPLARLAQTAKRGAIPTFAAVATAALAFHGVGLIVQPAPESRAPEASGPSDETSLGQPGDDVATSKLLTGDPAAAGDVAPPVGAAAKRSRGSQLDLQSAELPLPNGVQIAADKGLLEVNTLGSHKIYVDGVFIGRGPVRRVPLAAGVHEVQLRWDDEEATRSVTIAAGKRIRLEPSSRVSAD